MSIKHAAFFVFLLISSTLVAQQPEKPDASKIFEDIQKLNFLGSALYVAAHPDDENTAMISYLENEVKARTAYLSLTRGDGGQNLIGSDLRELLGVIRTQELLAARKIDGGEQRFTRANDFGYSKHPDETLEIWDKEKVLSDVVWAIRTFKPDIIINRFDHRSPGSTHGHHTSSAMLSVEAFEKAGNPNIFPQQLQYTEVWLPKRQFFNTSWWFYGSQEKFDAADKSNLVSVDVGSFYPGLGLSNTEISALSRSQHKSQGFGNTGNRGSRTEYLELLKGDYPKSGNLFEGINTTWSRVAGGKPIGVILQHVESNFDFTNPTASLPELLQAYQLITQLSDTYWKELKTKEITAIIKACSGLYLEAAVSEQTATANETIQVNIEAINRSNYPVTLTTIKLLPSNKVISIDKTLVDNQDINENISLTLNNASLTTAYWLTQKGSLGMYAVSDQELIGKPETPQPNKVVFNISFNRITVPITTDLVYKFTDRVAGEVYQRFEIVPPVSASIEDPVIIFASADPKVITVNVKAFTADLNGVLSLNLPKGWSSSPKTQNIQLNQKGETHNYTFTLLPPAIQTEGILTTQVTVNGKNYTDKIVQIEYDYIPLQTLVLPSESKIVRLDIQKKGEYIGYIMGAGDAIPQSLEQIGYQVALIDPDKISPELLAQFDAVVVGIRAYNTVDVLQFKQPILIDYVANGGTMIVQYNTASRGGSLDNLGPYPMEISHDRVTDENASVTFLEPNHPLLNFPNKITEKDFEGWVQERGLYFPSSWDDAYTPLFSLNDKGESPKKGSLLVTKHGKGYYIYTGLSFFRELPVGVSGAYRIFANMLSIGKASTQKIKG